MDGVQDYDEDQIAMVIPDLSKFVQHGSLHFFWNSHDKLHHECDQGEGDRCPGDALGKCLGGLSFGSLINYGHSEK